MHTAQEAGMNSVGLAQITKAGVISQSGKHVTEHFAAIPNSSALRIPAPISGEGLLKQMYGAVFQG
jgi:hypothetical protein